MDAREQKSRAISNDPNYQKWKVDHLKGQKVYTGFDYLREAEKDQLEAAMLTLVQSVEQYLTHHIEPLKIISRYHLGGDADKIITLHFEITSTNRPKGMELPDFEPVHHQTEL